MRLTPPDDPVDEGSPSAAPSTLPARRRNSWEFKGREEGELDSGVARLAEEAYAARLRGASH